MRLPAVAALLAMAGCFSPHPHPPHGGHVRATTTVVQRGHVHTAQCGHYNDRGGWYVVPDHLHQAGCGHVYRNGMWILPAE